MNVNVTATGKPMIVAINPDTRTWLMRSYGLSSQDADDVIERIANDVAASLNEPAPNEPAPAAEPLRVMTTTEGIGEAMRVHTWVNVERITQEVVANVTTIVADQLVGALIEGGKEAGPR